MTSKLAGPTEQPKEVRDYYEQSKDSLIMMVDDEPIVMGVIQAFLEDNGYRNFLLCEDSNQAIEMIHASEPDVLLLDLVMPGKTGFDILFELSRDPIGRHIPVVVLTSSSDSESKLRALEMGATDFLAKPVDPSELSLRLRNSLTVKAYQDRLKKYDQLTGLPNRGQFQERINWSFSHNKSLEQPLTLVHLGLDRFRMINNTMGSLCGDEILSQVASRLTHLVEFLGLDQAMVARLAGDEFAIVFATPESPSVEEIVREMQKELQVPMYIDDREVVVTVCVGVTTSDDVKQPDELVQKAGVALKHAKSQGVGKLELYSTALDAEAAELMALERALRQAMTEGALELFYQPKLTANEEKIYGFEALVRWRTDDGGMISPGKFIPVAENVGLIVSMGKWILRTACLQIKALEAKGVRTKISVNVSAHQLVEPDIVDSIRDALVESQLDPGQLIVEITESVMMGDVERSLSILHEIKALGCSLSVDDFGTGYSSLSYLKRFPIEELKIDQSFLVELPENPEDTAIVRAIIALAKSLDLSVTAEGVEKIEQVKYLAENGCDLLQGYHFSRPLPYEDVLEYYLAHDAG